MGANMKDILGFSKDGYWYKGNLHSHTTNSDGIYTPDQAVEEFKKKGYSFLCLSDHNLYTDYQSTYNSEEFIILPGLEASALLFDNNDNCLKVHHMNGILGTQKMLEEAKRPLFTHMEEFDAVVCHGSWNGAEVAEKMAIELHERGCIVVYNHPIWSRVEASEFINVNNIDVLEIFNYNTQNESGTGFDTTYWDVMLRNGRWIPGDAADDNHNGGEFDDAFGGYIVVKAEVLTRDEIISSILNGNYYSSAGPEIYDWGIRDGQVYVKCSLVERVNFVADGFVGSGTTVISDKKNGIQEASFTLSGKEHYVRVECIDYNGRKAWTNPIMI